MMLIKLYLKKIVSGEILIRDDKTKKDFTVSLIDFNNIKNNIIKVCNQLIIKGPNEKQIPDTIIYVNGLPLVVWEYKSTTREDATIYDAFVQIIIQCSVCCTDSYSRMIWDMTLIQILLTGLRDICFNITNVRNPSTKIDTLQLYSGNKLFV